MYQKMYPSSRFTGNETRQVTQKDLIHILIPYIVMALEMQQKLTVYIEKPWQDLCLLEILNPKMFSAL